MFWGMFYEACNLRGLKPNNVTKALGLSSATATKWKNGSDPKADALVKSADYLDVSVDYLWVHFLSILTRWIASKHTRKGLVNQAKTRKASAVWPMLENGGEGSRTPLATFGVMPYLKGFYGLHRNGVTHFLTRHASRAAHVLLPITPS